jgi:cell division protein FtsQ
MAQHHYSFPVLTGIDPGDPLASRSARMAVYERLLAELDANNQHLSDQISEIDLTDPEDARVLMPEPGADILAHLGQDHFLERYQRYKAHIAEWRQRFPKLEAVDLRYDGQDVLEMAHGTNAVEATPGAEVARDTSAKPSAGETADTANAAPTRDKADPNASKKPAKDAPPKSKTAAAKNSAAAKDKAAKDRAANDRAAKQKLIRDLTAKDKAARDKKKREAAQNTALNGAKGKPAPSTPTAAREGQ